MTGNALVDGNTKDVKIIVWLKYLRNFWRTLEMPFQHSHQLVLLLIPQVLVDYNNWYKTLTLSAQDNTKLLQPLNLLLLEKFTGTNMNQIQKLMHKTNI